MAVLAVVAEPDEAGAALAAGAGVEAGLAAGAGVDAGAGVEVAGAVADAEVAVPESAFLFFFDDFLLEPALVGGVA